MTTLVKPKERQFQVVPVPAVFTRGRWECIDYKDGAPGAPQFTLFNSLVATTTASQCTIPTTTASATAPTNDGVTIAGCCAGGGPNAVAIDNKIEQAMDLVKTHLTFAVREEVENMRSTITELESRVNLLESENQILRQFAPADVLGNLPALVQNAQIQQQQKIATQSSQQQSNNNNQSQPQQQKTFPTVPSAPVIMDASTTQAQQNVQRN